MKLLLAIFFSLMSLSLFAQEDDKYKEWIVKDALTDAIFFDSKTDYNDKDDLYAISKLIIEKLKLQDDAKKTFGKMKSDPLKDHHCAFIVVHNDFKVNTTGVHYFFTKANSILLHKEREAGKIKKKEWSEYMYQTRNVVIILLGNTGLDDDKKPLNLKLNITNNESFFRTSFKDLVDVVGAALEKEETIDDDYTKKTGIPCRVMWLSKVKVNPPTDFDFTIPIKKEETTEDKAHPFSVEIHDVDLSKSPQLKKDVETTFPGAPMKAVVTYTTPKITRSLKPDAKKFDYKIHERNNFAFSIGVTGAQFDYRNLSLDSVRNVAIAKLDSTKKKEWITNLNVNLEFYPFGRDVDQLEPFLKKPWHKLHTRFGIIGGVRLSKDPLTAVNLGLAFSYSKTVTITAGFSWIGNRVASDQTVKVNSAVHTIDEAKNYFNRKYERSKFSIGISFSPLQIAKALGIGEKKEEKKKEGK